MKKTINFVVDEEDYKIIKQNAEASNKTLVAFAREVLINHATLEFDYESIREHTKEISDLKNELNLVLHTIMDTEEAYNADIQTILSIMNDILKSEKKFLEQMEKDRERKRKEVKKQVKKLVDKQTNNNTDEITK